MAKIMDHAAYQRAMKKKKTIDELKFICRDAGEALDANPHGENAGYYADEICYASSELRRRGCFDK